MKAAAHLLTWHATHVPFCDSKYRQLHTCSRGTQVTVGRPSDATDELEEVLHEWGVEDLGEIAPTVICEVSCCTESSCTCTLDI